MTLTYEDISVVDLSAAGTADEQALTVLANQLHRACSQWGTAYLTNTGIHQSEIDKVFTMAREFFAIPLEAKMAIKRSEITSGLAKLLRHGDQYKELLAPDFRETFEISVSQEPLKLNQWPDEHTCPGFRSKFKLFTGKLLDLETTLMRVFKEVMPDSPVNLESMPTNSPSACRLIHYPGGDAKDFANRAKGRINPHTDWSSFTLLINDAENPGGEGLMIEKPDGRGTLIPAPPRRDAIIFQIGDYFKTMSNGQFKSGIHYVDPPHTVEGLVPDRYSIAFFAGLFPPDSALPRFAAKGEQPLDPVPVKDIMQAKVDAGYIGAPR